jgi:hypothetical protein
MPILSEYLPGLFRFKALCDKISVDLEEHALRVEFAARGALSPGNPTANTAPSYKGPIENIKPGDWLSPDRVQEYRDFMHKKKGVIVPIKIWSETEERSDLGIRPFQLDIKPEALMEDKTTNPFDE